MTDDNLEFINNSTLDKATLNIIAEERIKKLESDLEEK